MHKNNKLINLWVKIISTTAVLALVGCSSHTQTPAADNGKGSFHVTTESNNGSTTFPFKINVQEEPGTTSCFSESTLVATPNTNLHFKPGNYKTCTNDFVIVPTKQKSLTATVTFKCENGQCTPQPLSPPSSTTLNGGATLIASIKKGALDIEYNLPVFKIVNNLTIPSESSTLSNITISSSSDCNSNKSSQTIKYGETLDYYITNQLPSSCSVKITLQNAKTINVTFEKGKISNKDIDKTVEFKDWNQHAARDLLYTVDPILNQAVNSLTFNPAPLPFPVAVAVVDNTRPDYPSLEDLFKTLNFDPKLTVIAKYKLGGATSLDVGKQMLIVAAMMELTRDNTSFEKYNNYFKGYIKALGSLSYPLSIKYQQQPPLNSNSLADTYIATSFALAQEACSSNAQCKVKVGSDDDEITLITEQLHTATTGLKQDELYMCNPYFGGNELASNNDNKGDIHHRDKTCTPPAGFNYPPQTGGAFARTAFAMLSQLSDDETFPYVLVPGTIFQEFNFLSYTYYSGSHILPTNSDYISGDGDFKTYNKLPLLRLGPKNSFNKAGDTATNIPGFLGGYILAQYGSTSGIAGKNMTLSDPPTEKANEALALSNLFYEMQAIDGVAFNGKTSPYYTDLHEDVGDGPDELGNLTADPKKLSSTSGGEIVSFLLGQLGMAVASHDDSTSFPTSPKAQIDALKQALKDYLATDATEKHNNDYRDIILFGLYVDGAFNNKYNKKSSSLTPIYSNPLIKYPDIFTWSESNL